MSCAHDKHEKTDMNKIMGIIFARNNLGRSYIQDVSGTKDTVE